MQKLNEKEQAVFDYVCKISAKQGYAPSVRDICAALQYKSTSTVQMYLDRLLEYGYLCREAGKNRSLRPADGLSAIVSAREIPVARSVEQGTLTADCFVGTLPFFCGGADAGEGLFAFPMTEAATSSSDGECFGVAVRVNALTEGDTGVFFEAEKGFMTKNWENVDDELPLGKLIAVISILK